MPLFSNNVINTTKKVLDVTAILTKGTAEVLTYMEFQHKNQFELFLYPYSWDISSALFTAIADVITKLYVQTVEVTFSTYAYERADNIQYIKDVEYPESVKITFLEDELGSVRNFMDYWMTSVATIDDYGKFVFNDNQDSSKKKAMLIPLMKSGLPSGAWIQMMGLKIQSVGPITFDQASPEQMIIECDFVCDHVWWKTLASLI